MGVSALVADDHYDHHCDAALFQEKTLVLNNTVIAGKALINLL
jgi:hypothetical protein